MTLSNIDQYLTIPAVPTVPASLPPSGPAGGDLAGTYPNPTVAKINGVALGTTTATSGNLLVGSGTAWVSAAMSGDATVASTGALTLKNTGPGATGPTGDATHVAAVTIDAQGRVTALTSVAITAGSPGNLTGPITSVGLATSIASQTGTGTKFVVDTSPTLVTPNIGVATATTLATGTVTLNDAANVVVGSSTGTQIGTGSTQKLGFFGATPIVQPTGNIVTALQNLGLGASLTVTATTNANLTGPITSVGNATSIASQTGSGTKFVVDNAPTIQLPFIVDTTDNTKKIGFTLSGATTATTLTIVSAQTASRNLTVPVLGGNDIIAVLGTAQTFSATNTFTASQTFTNTINSTATTDSTTTATGAIHTSGGLGVTKTFWLGGVANLGAIGSTFTGNVIAGVQTALAAVAGQVGEVISQSISSPTNFTTTNVAQNMTSISLTAGDWLINCFVTFNSAGATLSGSSKFGISNVTAAFTASSPYNLEGLSLAYIPTVLFSTLSVSQSEFCSIRVNISATTTIYFVGVSTFTVGAPNYVCSMYATRMR